MTAMKKIFVCLAISILMMPVLAGERTPHAPEEKRDVVYEAKRNVAQNIASLLDDVAFQQTIIDNLSDKNAVAMGELLAGFQSRAGVASAKARRILDTDLEVRRWKGTEHLSNGLMELRLVRPEGDAGELDPASMLVAFEPRGEDKNWKSIEAFDVEGNLHTLDARVQPNFPILVADLDAREDLRAGIALANEMLVAAGMQKPVEQDADQRTGKACSGINTGQMTYIRLKDDHEPWIKGSAEIYAFVSGIDPTIADPEIRLVDMPYLDHDGTSYYPNQLVVYWYQYRYNTVNMTFYEHDDGTNYQGILSAVISGVRVILGAFAPQYAIIAEVANAILQAMPGSWFTDDDDYVDTIYTIDEDAIGSGRTYNGAGANVTLTLKPYCLN
ncbi:MAG: DUF3103 family protein [Acidobacteriota bacterium]|nr:DUF3103 family protein [Acidobacteriota bacterium]